MTINGISGVNTQAAPMGRNPATDSYSKNIQNQIANAQKQLQELSSNEELTLEEKMKKRQEIQQQISDLNQQLRQHQMELRRAERSAKQQAKGSSMDEMSRGQNAKTGGKSSGLSQAGMTAMISADTSMKLAKVQGSVAADMEGRAGVLKAEIKQEAGNDVIVEKKKEELADVSQKAQAATASQVNTLAEATQEVKEAAEAERTQQKASDTKEEKAARAESKTTGAAEGETVPDGVSADAQAGDTGEAAAGTEMSADSAVPPTDRAVKYKSIDLLV